MAKVAISNIKRANGISLFSISGVVTESEDTWQIILAKSDEAPSGSPRLRKAIAWIVGEDAAIIHRLQSGKKVERTIRKMNSGLISERSELIRPLLMSSIIEEEKLYEFQRTGVAWLIMRERAILADDMGLGKTTSAVIASLICQAKKVLVICPASLKLNWRREIENYTKDAITIIDGKKWLDTLIEQKVLK